MTTTKQWKKNPDGQYVFSVQGNEMGSMAIQINLIERKATITIGSENFSLKQTGFWKNNIEIEDANGNVVLKTYAEKWYANSSFIDFKNKTLKLKIRNNPLAEYVLLEGEKEILAYGLHFENKQIGTRIQTAPSNNDFLLDFLLWYLFVPVAHENMGDSDTFFMLTIA